MLPRDYQVSRADQDAFAVRSQQRAGAAQASGYFAGEIVPVAAPGGKTGPVIVDRDEHPRPDTTLEALAKLKPVVREGGTVTAGNASGVNDGAAALIIASEEAVKRHGLTPRAKILGYATAGVPPRVMGVGPVPATQKLMAKTGLTIKDFDIIELNEAFAAQALAVLRQLGIADDAAHVNPNGGAIAIGHPLGASGARLALTAMRALEEKRRPLCSGHPLHRCRAGRGAGDGTRLSRRRTAGSCRWFCTSPLPRAPANAGGFFHGKIKCLELLPKIFRAVSAKTIIGFARRTIHHMQKREGESLGTEHAERT